MEEGKEEGNILIDSEEEENEETQEYDPMNEKNLEDIPNKFYDIINMGDEVMQTDAKVAKELVKEYKDYLTSDGRLIAYFNSDEHISEIFDGETYQVVNVRTPRVGVSSGGNNIQQQKLVILQKKL